MELGTNNTKDPVMVNEWYRLTTLLLVESRVKTALP